jgi:hypothetical protein
MTDIGGNMDAQSGPRGVLAGYLSEQEMAAELGRSTRTLKRWRDCRIGPPFITIGHEIRYSTEAARAWLAAGGSLRKSGRSKTR